jgi:Flp pilus assembly protein TadD
MIALAVAAALAAAGPKPAPAPAAQPPVHPLSEAAHAIEAGRPEQARLMIANAVKAGAKGREVDRLIADLAFVTGDYKAALPAYRTLLVGNTGDARLYERAGLSAARLGDMAQAASLLERATAFPSASWRAWNARGVAADFRRDWAVADESYARAAALAPRRAEIFNNAGWSLLVRGRWDEALARLEQAAALDSRSARIDHNLELARAAVSQDLPGRRAGENDEDWAARLNDAGVMARVRGDTKKAAAAFAQAVEIRSQYYERAANNLAQVERSR